MDRFAIFIGILVSWISKTLNLGAGATWPGEVALFLDPHILSTLAKKIRKGIIIVAGTNGKTTTTLMIEKILEAQGYSVVHNTSGANLVNGIVSSLLTEKDADYGIFEVDENAMPEVMRQVTMSKEQKVILVLLNLFRDQLDRYGEVTAIGEKWIPIIGNVNPDTDVIINADDPLLAHIGSKSHGHTKYFGLGDKKYYIPKMQHATDTIYCPKCSSKLVYKGIYYSHLGDFACPTCEFSHPLNTLSSHDVKSPLEGVYNIYNTMAATAVGQSVGILKSTIKKALSSFEPAFGRMEELTHDGKKIKILLSKNPTGFNESLRTALSSQKKGPMMIAINDRIPDGTDISWIWDVDFEQLQSYEYPLVISGDRALDMGLRMKYAVKSEVGGQKSEVKDKIQKWEIHERLSQAIQIVLDKTQKHQTLWILATYSAMLDVRKILTGRKIL